jgi:hypothetical protein
VFSETYCLILMTKCDVFVNVVDSTQEYNNIFIKY